MARPEVLQHPCLIPHPQCGVVRLEIYPLLLARPLPGLAPFENPECRVQRPRSAQPQMIPGVPTPPCPCNAQPQSVLGGRSPRVSLQCPSPHDPWSAHPSVSLECPTPECRGRVGMFEEKTADNFEPALNTEISTRELENI